MSESRKLYRRFGFAKALDLRRYLLVTIPMLIFVLHTLPWSRHQVGLYLHLWTVFPAALLAMLQFIPAIRARRIHVHRFLGYICRTLGITAGITALIIGDRSFGGFFSTRLAVCVLATVCFMGHYKAIRAVRSYHLDEHREWMLRTWLYMGSILTMRPIVFVSALAVSFLAKHGIQLQAVLPCPQIFHILANGRGIGISNVKPDFFTTYGFGCSPTLNMMTSPSPSFVLIKRNISPLLGYEAILANASMPVEANLISSRVDSIGAALDISFGPAFLIGIAINAVVAEWYIRRIQAEAQRLQKLSALRRKLAKQKRQSKSGVPEYHFSEQSIRTPDENLHSNRQDLT